MADPSIPAPSRRKLQAYAYDPLLAELNDTVVDLDVAYEPLQPGPVGALVKVVDFDPVRGCWYTPVDLDDPMLLAQNGLAPSEADPRFHQQMVYAVASSVLEHLERSLGRRFRFGTEPLVVYPHAFRDQNAYYDPDRRALLFGYFRADRTTPGRMLPGQWVFTCLSHDIIAHELTHAVVDRLRPELIYPTNHDVAAFHEAFADLVALFHHFTLPDLVRRHLQSTRGDVASAAPLVDLAAQFGEAAGIGAALRSGIDDPDATRLPETLECHDRGSILVGAVFSAFLDTYKSRVADLLRIATGGTGELAAGSLHPDLVARLASEVTSHAARFLAVCVRAFDYLPVVDVTFGDFLRAIVTADRALFPTDGGRLRAVLVESFRRRGIYPHDVGSLSERGLCWPEDGLGGITFDGTSQLVQFTAEDFDVSTRETTVPPKLRDRFTVERKKARKALAVELHRTIAGAPEAFGFDPSYPIAVRGFHASFRAGEDGQPRVDVVIQARQERPDLAAVEDLDGTGLKMYAGTTIVADSIGRIRHVITKPLPAAADGPAAGGSGGERFERILDFVADRDALDPSRPWVDQTDRIVRQLSFANLHAARAERAAARP